MRLSGGACGAVVVISIARLRSPLLLSHSSFPSVRPSHFIARTDLLRTGSRLVAVPAWAPRDPSFTGRLSLRPRPLEGLGVSSPPGRSATTCGAGSCSRVAGVIVPAPGALGRRGRVPSAGCPGLFSRARLQSSRFPGVVRGPGPHASAVLRRLSVGGNWGLVNWSDPV